MGWRVLHLEHKNINLNYLVILCTTNSEMVYGTITVHHLPPYHQMAGKTETDNHPNLKDEDTERNKFERKGSVVGKLTR